MRRAIISLVAIAFSLPTLAATFIIGVAPPEQLNDDDSNLVLQGVSQTIQNANPGDKLAIVNALDMTVIVQITIPQGSGRERGEKLQRPMTRLLQQFLSEAPATPSTGIDLPRFVDEAIANLHEEGQDTRVLLFGHFYDTLGGNNVLRIEPGEYFSDGFIIAGPESPWGTSGRPVRCRGVTLHWVYLGESGDQTQRAPMLAFYSKWFQAKGGVLVNALSNPVLLYDSYFENNRDPLIEVQINQQDTALAIRRAGDVGVVDNTALDTARIQVNREAREVLQQMVLRDQIVWEQPVTVVVVPDASSSWSSMQATTHATIEAAARLLPDHSRLVRVGVAPFRDEVLPRFPMTRIFRNQTDQGASLERLNSFLNGLSPSGSRVDIERAVTAVIDDLERDQPQGRCVIVLVTDEDTEEGGDPAASRRLTERVRQWSESSNHRFVSVYVGSNLQGDEASYLRSLADQAGRQGRYVNDLDDLIEAILRASLDSR